ncbi:MAG: hypothetical protein PHO91_01540 [Patescibacteria group bacterium]|nr:hypothetical protein [Patescibacteria group bacterium]
MDNIILTIITSLASGGLGAWLTYYFGIKSKKTEAMLKFKEEKYAKLLIYLQGFVGNTTSGNLKKKFFEEQYSSWLYCSDEVVKSLNRLVQLLISEEGKAPNPEDGQKVIGEIVLNMRKDLLGKTSLNYKDFKYTSVIEN